MSNPTIKTILQAAHSYFDDYVASFYHTDDQEVIRGIKLKEEHTKYVTANAIALAKLGSLRGV